MPPTDCTAFRIVINRWPTMSAHCAIVEWCSLYFLFFIYNFYFDIIEPETAGMYCREMRGTDASLVFSRYKCRFRTFGVTPVSRPVCSNFVSPLRQYRPPPNTRIYGIRKFVLTTPRFRAYVNDVRARPGACVWREIYWSRGNGAGGGHFVTTFERARARAHTRARCRCEHVGIFIAAAWCRPEFSESAEGEKKKTKKPSVVLRCFRLFRKSISVRLSEADRTNSTASVRRNLPKNPHWPARLSHHFTRRPPFAESPFGTQTRTRS